MKEHENIEISMNLCGKLIDAIKVVCYIRTKKEYLNDEHEH